MARTYKRDSRGRFAGGGGSSGRPAARPVSRGTNRLTRDNAGRIASVGGSGATARGGRLRTASGKQRATQTARVKGGGGMLRGGAKGKGSGIPKLKFDAAANSRRLARATARIDKAWDRNDTFMVNRIAKARGSYMRVAQATKGDAAKAKALYRKEARYSTVKNPKNPKRAKPPSKGRTLPSSEAMARRTEAMLRRGVQTGNRAQQYLRDRGAQKAPLGSRLSLADGRAGRVVWANRNRLAYYANQRLNAARRDGRLS